MVGAAALKAPHQCSELLDQWRWKNPASLLLPLVTDHSAGLTWPSSLFCLDDCEGLWRSAAVVGAQPGCESAPLHWEHCPPIPREVTWSMCDWRGFPPMRVSLKERAHIVRTPVSACTRPVEFYRSKQVKTAHCVSLFCHTFPGISDRPVECFSSLGWNTFCQAVLSTNPVLGANGFRSQISVSHFQFGEMLVPDLLLVVNWFPF